ncbi:putative ribonuclease H protein [Senna tora]|uniref:Putative ribonuclease H protein n=1 Tax=Senna tora TaxID=362788 RepID=A0A834WQ26_9FABA|nr:putative ribonuclease H protein [Senna tora]
MRQIKVLVRLRCQTRRFPLPFGGERTVTETPMDRASNNKPRCEHKASPSRNNGGYEQDQRNPWLDPKCERFRTAESLSTSIFSTPRAHAKSRPFNIPHNSAPRGESLPILAVKPLTHSPILFLKHPPQPAILLIGNNMLHGTPPNSFFLLKFHLIHSLVGRWEALLHAAILLLVGNLSCPSLHKSILFLCCVFTFQIKSHTGLDPTLNFLIELYALFTVKAPFFPGFHTGMSGPSFGFGGFSFIILSVISSGRISANFLTFHWPSSSMNLFSVSPSLLMICSSFWRAFKLLSSSSQLSSQKFVVAPFPTVHETWL